jgi:uncharacterized protein YbjT (DUF2867 family)
MDIDGTRRLLDFAKRAGVPHFFYISIVGVDRHPYPYYQHKLAVEQLVRDSGLPWTIFRATQFHSLIDRIFMGLLGSSWPFGFVPLTFQAQPIATSDAAAAASAAVTAGPAGLLPDVGGPEVLRFGDMVPLWLAARRQRKLVLPVWLPLKWAESFRQGHNTCPDHKIGKQTFSEWLTQKYGRKTEDASR